MPHDLRLTTLLERHYVQHTYPLEHLKAQLQSLDELCRTLGVSRLSLFIDISAIEWQEAARLAEADAGTAGPDSETGLAIEDLSWYPATLGMASLDALILHLQRGDNVRFASDTLTPLLAELQFCSQQLAPLECDGGQFHLAAG